MSNINVTDNAFKRVEELASLEQNGANILRISVESGGCSGLMYHYQFISKDEVNNDDQLISNGKATIVIDNISAEFMQDSMVDFIEELGAAYFKIENPKAKSKCGCGNSFTSF